MNINIRRYIYLLLQTKIVVIFLTVQLLCIIAVVLFVLLRTFNLKLFSPVFLFDKNSETWISQVSTSGLLLSYASYGLKVIFFAFEEEFINRFLPFLIWRKFLNKWVPFWLVLLLTSVVFALGHTNLALGFRFPLIQFMLGTYYGYLYINTPKDGLVYGTFAHATYNFSTSAYSRILYMLFS